MVFLFLLVFSGAEAGATVSDGQCSDIVAPASAPEKRKRRKENKRHSIFAESECEIN
jgi:hypothetical protein